MSPPREAAMNTRATVTIILALLALAAAIQGQEKSGAGICRTVYTVDSSWVRSVVAGARVSLTGPSLHEETITNESGAYSFTPAPSSIYRIDVTAPGLSGSKTVTLVSNSMVKISIELTVNAVKESVTVTADADAPVPTQPSDQAVIEKTTIFNAPNKRLCAGICRDARHAVFLNATNSVFVATIRWAFKSR